MNKLITILAGVLLYMSSLAQAPNKMSYQCVIRNAGGTLGNQHGSKRQNQYPARV